MELKDITFERTRISDQVKEILKRSIFEGEVKPGDKIPTEEKLAQQLKVSKVTVREALRDLEGEGLIEKRRGVYGGSFVSKPGWKRMGELVINYYRFGGVAPEELVEFRELLEPVLVALASERRTDQDLRGLKANIEEVEKGINQGRLNQPKAIEFHRLIADACHNRLISAVMDALVKVFAEILSGIPFTPEDVQADLDFSKRLYDCLVQSRAKEASKLMAAHFEVLKSIIERTKTTERKGKNPRKK
jgi:GntR family transcriptional repressor for pyruvate dehydrogenase complex